MILEEQILAVRDGELVDTGSWVYAWQRPDTGEVVYVGATGLDPAVRCWLHLEAEDPVVGRIRHEHPEAMAGDVVVRAFRLDPKLDRSAVKAEVIRRLAGGEEGPRPSSVGEETLGAVIVAEITSPTRRTHGRQSRGAVDAIYSPADGGHVHLAGGIDAE